VTLGSDSFPRLHEITGEQLAAYPSRAIGVLGIAGGNGLDLIDPETTDAVYGYDINPDYLAACEARYREDFGDRLHLIETRVDRSVTIERVDLLIANLIIEYVGLDEFVAFAAANARSMGVLSSVDPAKQRGRLRQLDRPCIVVRRSRLGVIGHRSRDADVSDVGWRVRTAGPLRVSLAERQDLIRQDFRPGP
jgi:hypothetical protein